MGIDMITQVCSIKKEEGLGWTRETPYLWYIRRENLAKDSEKKWVRELEERSYRVLCIGSQGSQLKGELKCSLICHLEVFNPCYSNFFKVGMEAGAVCQS